MSRLLSMMLIAVLLSVSLIAPAQAMTAEEALFGNGTAGVTVAPVTPAPTPEMTEVPEGTEIPGETEMPQPDEYPTLQLNDRDAADETPYVEMLQNRLIALGFLTGRADGVFGENTETAVDQFQRLNGLERTGVADHETQALMYSDMSLLNTPQPDDQVAFGSRNIRVQTKLVEWGFLSGTVDGVLGKKSTTAIRNFKAYVTAYFEANPTPSPTPVPTPTPMPTPAPGEMPMVEDIPIVTPAPTPMAFTEDGEIDDLLLCYVDGELEFPVIHRTVQNGDRGMEVARVQTRLNCLNYLYIHTSPDGVFGLNTARALMYFQRKNGLPETGIADEATQRVLYSAEPVRSEEYVFPYKLGVSLAEQRVYAAKWDGTGYNIQERTMLCSTGRDETPTPTGTYQGYGNIDGEWHWFEDFECYAKWAYGIIGDILFHSVLFNEEFEISSSSVHYLGRQASHGCIRLSVEDAKWIVDNCPVGTTIVIW